MLIVSLLPVNIMQVARLRGRWGMIARLRVWSGKIWSKSETRSTWGFSQNSVQHKHPNQPSIFRLHLPYLLIFIMIPYEKCLVWWIGVELSGCWCLFALRTTEGIGGKGDCELPLFDTMLNYYSIFFHSLTFQCNLYELGKQAMLHYRWGNLRHFCRKRCFCFKDKIIYFLGVCCFCNLL